MKRINQIVAILCLSMFALLFQNCDGSFNKLSDKLEYGSGEDIEEFADNYKPKIDCLITSDSRSSENVYQRMSSINDEFGSSNFLDNESLSIDCGDTTDDESSIAEMKFYIDLDYDPSNPQFVLMSGTGFDLNELEPGTHNIAVKVVDDEGEETIKQASVPVKCLELPVLNSPTAAISVSEGAYPGMFNYSINESFVDSPNDYDVTYAWDFNGDGVMDPYEPSKNGDVLLWTSSTMVEDQVSVLVNERPLTVKLKNICGENEYIVDKNLATSHPIARTPDSLATPLGYFYLQGDVRNTSDNLTALDEQRRNADYLATKDGSNIPITNFQCNLKNQNGKSTITIDTGKTYRKNEQELNMGSMYLFIDEIPDNGEDTLVNVSYDDNARLRTLTYAIGGMSEGLPKDYFNDNKNCKVKLTLRRAFGVKPCNDGSEVESQTIDFWGEFDCGELSNDKNQTISIENGKFYCGYAIADRCAGGGGGGGGVLPPEF